MSEKVKFFYYNLVDQPTTVITGGNENAQFPASNLKLHFKTKVYRSTTSTDSVVFDFTTAEPVNSILVAANPIDGFGFSGSLTIEANATDSWGSPSFSTTLTPNYEFNLGIKTLTSSQSYRYWRITGTNGTYFELGKVFIGSYFQPQRNIRNSFNFDQEDTSKKALSRYAQKFIDETPDQKNITAELNLIDKDNVDSFFDFINYVGEKRPFWVVLNESEEIINEKERIAGMFYFKSKPRAKHVIRGLYSFSLSMEEAG